MIKFLYLGGFDNSRDIKTIITGFSKLLKQGERKILVQLVGAEPSELTFFNKIILEAKAEKYIKVISRVPLRRINKYLKNASFGLVPHKKNFHTDTTIPHKIFQYMNFGLPVIVSNCDPLVRIVKTAKCGFIYKSESPQNFMRCVSKVLKVSLKRRKQMGLRGRLQARTKHTWSICEKRLLICYKRILKDK